MLELKVPARSLFNDETQEFLNLDEVNLKLEHSLISLDKWESETEKPFLKTLEKGLNDQDLMLYIKCMSINPISLSIIQTLPSDVIEKIVDYLDKPMTATTFNENDSTPSRDILTSEVIYYMMIKLGIPFECQKMHLNKLITLIRVCSIKDGPQKKMSKSEIMAQNRALNEARKAKAKTRG